MNRPGQPQQRPPNLTTNPALSSQFRPSYPTYGLPPRNVLQGTGTYLPSLQPSSHRTSVQQSQSQALTPQPTPTTFTPTRGSQSSYAFGGGLGQHQPSSALGQQPMPSQQQPNGTQGTMSSLLVQPSGLSSAPSISSSNEVALDPNDFPALGSGPTNQNQSSTTNGLGSGTTSYASQAGTGVLLSTNGTSGGNGTSSNLHQARDFTPDDFPALGGGNNVQQGQAAQQQSRDGSGATNGGTPDNALSHPPGLNGFQSTEQQLRQNLLGPHSTGLQQNTPGLLNLGPTHRNVHPGFQAQGEAEKQQQRPNFSLKLNTVAHAAWTPSSANPIHQLQPPTNTSGTNGNVSQNQLSVPITNSGTPSIAVPPFSSNGVNTSETHVHSSIPNPSGSSNPMATTNNNNATSLQTTSGPQSQHPQTPAQQVLISAADRWGLLSLIAYMRNASTDVDHGLTSVGTDLGTMGLDMAYSGNLYSTFITPWADQSAARTVEPDFHIPQCYQNVHAPPPGPAKAVLFSDETLFFMFYSSPRDALQEVAAQELWNRNWRFHKELRMWITKETGTSQSQKVQGGQGEQGHYTFWDHENWTKEQKEMTVLYSDLEEKSVPAYLPGPGLVPAPGVGQPQPVSPAGQLPGQPSLPTRASFQMGMAGL